MKMRSQKNILSLLIPIFIPFIHMEGFAGFQHEVTLQGVVNQGPGSGGDGDPYIVDFINMNYLRAMGLWGHYDRKVVVEKYSTVKYAMNLMANRDFIKDFLTQEEQC